VAEADHAAGVGRLVAAAAPDLDPVGVLGLLGPADGPAGHGQLGLAVLMATAAVVTPEVGAGVVGQRQTRQHGRGGGDGTPNDELPFDLPHAPSFVLGPVWCATGLNRFARIVGIDRQLQVSIRGPRPARLRTA